MNPGHRFLGGPRRHPRGLASALLVPLAQRVNQGGSAQPHRGVAGVRTPSRAIVPRHVAVAGVGRFHPGTLGGARDRGVIMSMFRPKD